MNREIVLFCCFFRFTKKEKVIQNTFGEQAARYTMTLLTREDNLKEQDIINKHPDLSDIISECDGGHRILNKRNENRSIRSESCWKNQQ